jgi:hypothetical protein
VASPVLPCPLVCLRPCPPGPCQRRTVELIMLPGAGRYRVPRKPKDLEAEASPPLPPPVGCRVPGKPKMLETRAPQNQPLRPTLANVFLAPDSQPARRGVSHLPSGLPGSSGPGRAAHALVTVAISHGLLGRPVPSALLPSWPSPAIDATTSRDALSILPKIVKFGF